MAYPRSFTLWIKVLSFPYVLTSLSTMLSTVWTIVFEASSVYFVYQHAQFGKTVSVEREIEQLFLFLKVILNLKITYFV